MRRKQSSLVKLLLATLGTAGCVQDSTGIEGIEHEGWEEGTFAMETYNGSQLPTNGIYGGEEGALIIADTVRINDGKYVWTIYQQTSTEVQSGGRVIVTWIGTGRGTFERIPPDSVVFAGERSLWKGTQSKYGFKVKDGFGIERSYLLLNLNPSYAQSSVSPASELEATIDEELKPPIPIPGAEWKITSYQVQH